jgi:hypothetical protein
MRKATFAVLLLLVGVQLVTGQSTYQGIARDTIVTLRKFPTRTYLLDGKKLNLAVMDWFMTDYPAANDQIKLSILTEQASAASYSIGILFGLTGLLVNRQDPHLGGELLQIGGVGIGSGIVFHLFSASFKRKAVRYYNEDVQRLYKSEGNRLQVKFQPNRMGLGIRFE